MTMTYRDNQVRAGLTWARECLLGAGIDTPQLDAELLLSHVTGLSRTQLIAHPEREVSDDEYQLFCELVERRQMREPLPYLLGEWEFWGLKFEVNPSVLIPRPETEILVEACAEWVGDRQAMIAEIGAGSGAILVALATELPSATLFGTEICPDAAGTAMRNVERHGLADRITVLIGDLAQPLRDAGLTGRLDAIVSNPPYIVECLADDLQPEVQREPRLATVAGPDPLVFYRRILDEAFTLLKAGGRIFFEIDPGLTSLICDLGAERGFRFVEMRCDLAGLERVVILECVYSK
jgi:release factor glutamine methyltransferase